MTKKRPLLFLCVAALLGTYGGLSFAVSWHYLAALGLALFLLILLSPQRIRIMSFCGLTALMCAFNAQYQKSTYNEKLRLISKESPIHGLVQDVRMLSGWEKKALIQTSSSTIELTLKDAASMLPLQPGYHVSVAATLQNMKPPLSPVVFDAYSYGLSRGIHAHAFIKDPELIIYEKGAAPFLSSLRSSLRQKFFAYLAPHQASLLLALILGETDLFSHTQKEIYQTIGAQHLLAVSGLQVSMLAGICYIILALLFNVILPPHRSLASLKIAALLAISFVWFFVALCHNPPSAIRAGLMATVALFPALFGRRVDLLDALLVSCFLSVLFDPLCMKDLGFLLSYAATLGLICTHNAGQSWTKIIRAQSALGAVLFTWCLSCLGAFLATLPIICLYFGTFVPSSILANVFLVPVAALLQIPAIILGLLGALLHSPLSLEAAGFCASLIELCTELLGSLLGGISYIPQFSNWALILCTVGTFILFLSILQKQTSLIRASCIAISISFINIIPYNNPPLLMTVIPVGQGDSSLVQLPSGENILIDAGGNSFSDYDPGASIVVPTLQRLGVKKLDILVISHPDPDHLLGAFAVLESIPVKEIWHSGFKDGHPLTERLFIKAKEKGLPIKNTRELLGSHHFGETNIIVLAPNTHTEEPYFAHLKANDNSLVVRITHEQKSLLWPGDLEKKGEELLLQENEDLRADIIKAPHHGSRTSSTEAFIERVNPRFVIFSTGYNNRFSFPHENIVERYRERGIMSFNTAVDGQIKIEISKKGIDIAGFSSSCKRISLNCA